MNFGEPELEESALEWFEELYYERAYGPDLADEREDYREVLLKERVREALERLNPALPSSVLDEALRKVSLLDNPRLINNNFTVHRLLTEGVEVTFQQADGSEQTEKIWLVDWNNPSHNNWLVVNQFRVLDRGGRAQVLDLVVFLNGLPIVVFELKSMTRAQVRITHAYEDIQRYQDRLPTLFAYNAFSVISDGIEARYGTITADFDRYQVWRTIDGEHLADSGFHALEVLIKGMFAPDRLLKLLKHYLLFFVDGAEIKKIVAAYHQYFATEKAVTKTHFATSQAGDQKVGVIWHTQGSGKSLTMTFYAGKLVAELDNPTIVVVTDRNDLDDQLFGIFSQSEQLLRQTPKQAQTREQLREMLQVEAGGIIFTTMQKFSLKENETHFPLLTNRRNVVVIVDEAHRTQYGLEEKVTKEKDRTKITFGFAKHMRTALPQASYIGFTGTPIELADRNTPAVFGDYIDIYDFSQAVEDGATVKIYYESRLAEIELPEQEKEELDQEFQQLLQEEEVDESVKGRWARLEVLVGTEQRLKKIARDIVDHFERRQSAIQGKAMIVTMSRRIAVALYEQMIQYRPAWHHDELDQGKMKVVMTSGPDDPEDWNQHKTTSAQRKQLAKRMKDPEDELQLVIVCDMWLTGFDVPCLSTIYIDKPMKGHNLMQAITRVNRVFKDKPGGLVVDYIGIGHPLREALKFYQAKDRQTVGIDLEQALELMIEKYDLIQYLLHPHDYSAFLRGGAKEKARQIAATADYVISLGEEKKKEFLKQVTLLAQAFTLCVTHPRAESYQPEVSFLKAVKAAIVKLSTPLKPRKRKGSSGSMEAQVQQMISKSVITDEVIDLFDVAGLNKPNLSILSEEFLEEVQDLEYQNLAVELLKRLLKDQVREISRKNTVQSKKFSEMLEQTIKKYHERLIDSSAIIQELVEMAKNMNQTQQRGDEWDMREEELALYDALTQFPTDKAVWDMETLRPLVRELLADIRRNRIVDWHLRINARAHLRLAIKKLLKKYQYPYVEEAAASILEQCEALEKNGYFDENPVRPNSKPIAMVAEPKVEYQSDWIESVAEPYRHVAIALAQGCVLPPEIGYEFVNQEGFVVAEAEFAWPKQKVCFLTPVQAENRASIHQQGWKVWVLPEERDEGEDYVKRFLQLANGESDDQHQGGTSS